MKKLLALIIFLSPLLTGCSRSSAGTTTVVKPKTYNRFYDRKKDKRKPRTKMVRMKN